MKELYRFRQFLTEGKLLKEDQKYYSLLNDLRDEGLLNKSGISGLQSKFNLSKEKAKEIFDEYLEDLKAEQPDAFDFFMKEGVIKKEVTINGKTIDVSSIKIEGVDTSQGYDDGTTDAFASYAEFKDGSELSDNELDKLTDENSDLIHELALEVFQMGESTPGYKELKENITKLDNYALEIYSDFRKDPSIHFPDVEFEVDEEGFALENDSNYSQLKKYKREIMGLHALFGEESGVKDKNGLQLSMDGVIDNI
jgi:hypothetical protein